MDRQEEYARKMHARLKQADMDIVKLEESAERSDVGGSSEYEEYIRELRERRQQLRDRWEEAKDQSDDSWEGFLRGLDNAWDDLQRTFEKARARMR
ncbi:hypothetical protein [Minwuia thermotolerans]|uniref:Uncharacterized protein n=1 Tax=Minwuia thermotolerans TaxID=2056226 RepID=A0A2M9FY76_9PROT|nr:hypothetical protein [Minwuia thermotolerans]PJK28413.1 hypothetical protein CVT23_17070 [Minwuia thermotolerans]